MKIKDSVAIITGASAGIGEAIAKHLASRGAKVVLAARRKEELERVESEIRNEKGEALAVKTDVTSFPECENLIRQALDKYGKVDILINNAGIHKAGDIVDLTMMDFEASIETNLLGAIRCTKLVIDHMLQSKSGVIINMSSIAGVKGFEKETPYCASKFGLTGFSQALQEEVRKEGIQVYTVCPGSVDSPMCLIPYGDPKRDKVLKPENIAEIVEFLITRSPGEGFDNIVVYPAML